MGFQVLVLFGLAVAIPVIIALAQIRMDLAEAQVRADEQAVSAAQIAAVQLDTTLVELQGFGATVGQLPEFWAGDDTDRDRILTALIAPYASLDSLSYFTADFQEHGRTTYTPGAARLDFSTRGHAREAVETGARALASQPLRALARETLLLPVAFPVAEAGGTQQHGFMNASLSLAGPLSLWQDLPLPAQSTVLLVDARGWVLLGASRPSTIVRVTSAPDGAQAGATTVADASGAEHIWAWHRVSADSPWIVAVDVPADGVLAAGRAEAVSRMVTALGTAVLAWIILASVGRRQYRRLLALRSAARQWANGSWSHRSGVIGKDELGALGEVFDSMAGQADVLQLASQQQLQRATELSAELATSEQQLRGLYDAMACGVVVLAADGRVLRSNPAAEAVLGLTGAELQSEPLWAHCQPVEADGSPLQPDHDPVALALHDRRVVRGRTLGFIRHRDQRWLEMDVVPTWSSAGDVRLVVSFLDVTDRKQAEASLSHQALHDGLTTLPNRSLLLDRLSQAGLAAVRGAQPLALLVVNLDRFKDVNETLGREAGDLLLRETARRLQGSIRASDTVARLGADEFAVLVPATETLAACRLAEQLVSALGQTTSLNGNEIQVGVSIGIVTFPEHGPDAESLLRQADRAMHRAKQEHGGYAVYSADHESAGTKRLIMMSGLRRAIDHDELTLAYQPKIACRSGALIGVEGLVRWQHAELGMIPPDDFIGLAEETGLIKALTGWVLNAALQQCHTWRQQGLHIPVAVNLSAHDVQDPGLPDLIANLLATWQIPANWLKVELTETALLAEPLRAMHILKQLSDSGVRVSIDDFGTGYSSLAYLKRLPIDELKIDRGFVSDLRGDRKDLAIVRSTIELGHTLGFEVVAEGVEDQTTLDVLESMGCDIAQGYFISRPLPADELARWCRTTQRGTSTDVADVAA